MKRASVALLVASGLVLPAPLRAQAPRIIGPDTVTFTSGALTLHGIVYRPAGAGPFPTILFNHGSGKSYTKEVEAVGPTYAGLGYAFFAPSRRGQWLSAATGQYIVDSLDAIEKLKGVAARDPLLVELMKGPQLADVRAALAFITTKPYVRKDRVIVAGNSFGGIVTIFASAHIEGLWAALDFAGAAQTWASAPQLQAGMTDAATHSRIPIFFGQAANDYDLSPSRVLSAAMTAAGKANLMKIFPPFGKTTPEGHSFGYFGGATWGPDVSAFVKNPPKAGPPTPRGEPDIPASAYAARRAALARQIMPAAIIINGKNLVGQHELPRQDENFWYLTGVESPYAILVMAPETRANASRGDVRTALFLPDTFEFAGAQMPMVDSGFRRAAWNEPHNRLAPGPGAAWRTGIAETYPLSEFAARMREIVGGVTRIYLPQSTDSLYAPPGVARPLTAEQQTSRAIAALFPERTINDVTPLVRKMRLVKDQYEIAALRAAAGASAQSMVTLMRRVKPGMNDLEAAGILEAEWKRLGSPRASFGPIISSGPKAMTFFSLAGESYDAVGRVMQAGDLLFNDYGAAEVRHYASDICRTFPVSGTFTAEQRMYYDIVLEAQEAAIAAVKPGVMMLDVIRAAARVYRAHGLEKYEDVGAMGAARVWGVMPSPTHYLARNGGITNYTRFGGGVRDIGHHVGLNATDSRDWSEPLAAGMVVTIEPKIYIPEKNIAIMIEDMILVTPGGHENLSATAPKKADDIERVMRRP